MSDDAIYDLLWRLAGSPDERTNFLELDPTTLHRVMSIARIHGVLGIVLSKGGDIESGVGVTWENIRRAWKRQLMHSLRIRHHAQYLLDQFKQKGIPAVIFKGIDFADHLYLDPRLRPMTDVDILIPRDHWFDAVKALESIGHKEKLNQSKPIVREGIFSERTWIYPLPGILIEVDLHWSLVHFPELRRQVGLGYWDLDWKWLPGGHGELTPASRLVIAAIHVVYHHQFDRLIQLVDVQNACAKVATDVDQQNVRALAERTGAKLAIDIAMRLTACFLNDPAVERLRQILIGKKCSWDRLPDWFYKTARDNLRSIRTSFSSGGTRRIRKWLSQQQVKPTPGWELSLSPSSDNCQDPTTPQSQPRL